jgi:hypothetical protein
LSVVVKLNGDTTMTGPLKAANGSVSAPSITFASDTDLGFYRVSSDILGVTVGGVLVGTYSATGFTASSTDAGAAAGPVITLYRDSASPAASDIIGQVSFEGEDSAGNQQQYASVDATILDPTTTQEDGKLNFNTTVAGTAAERAYIGQGLVIGSPTGGDKGAGAINATAIYVNNTQFSPAFPLPGAVGLVVTNNAGTPNTILDLDASVVVMSNSSNLTVISTAVDLSINAGTVGANGIDAGSLANNTWYYAYAIHNGSAVAGLLSASATSPTMPSGYTYKVLLGAIKTGGSATFLRVIQRGRISQYQVIAASTTPNLPQMATGTAGDPVVPTWSSVAVGSYVPTIATVIRVGLFEFSSSGLSMAAPNNAYGAYNSTTNPPPLLINAGGAATGGSILGDFVLESTNIYWAANSANARLNCLGWVNNVNAS